MNLSVCDGFLSSKARILHRKIRRDILIAAFFFLLNRSCDSLNIRVSEMWISFSVSHFSGLKHHLIISSETSEEKC